MRQRTNSQICLQNKAQFFDNTRVMQRVLIIHVLLILSFALSCSSGFYQRKPLNDTQDLGIFAISSNDYPDADIQSRLPEMSEMPPLTKEKIWDVLGNLVFRKESIWGDLERRAFYPAELQTLAPMISQSIPRLAAGERLLVLSRHDPDRSVLSRAERTSLLMWADEEGLNLLFGEIKEELPNNDYLTEDDWMDTLPISFKRSYRDLSLVESSDYSLKIFNGKPHLTWAVINLEQLDKLKYVSPDKKEKPQKSPTNERLKELKKLLDDGMITKEEYEEKRKEILEQL